ncbi:MAG: thiamine diphosphokinase [Anaerolineae bacterium]|nr:MAG: thiamine diphosphokinase [Anaerolineae bacterium]
MRVAIFANGVIENVERAREATETADLMLAANGGALHCLRLGVIPDIVIGDVDSLDDGSRRALEAGGTEFIVHLPNKDRTDLELALLTALARDAEKITVLGAMGGRLDMTFANVLLLALPELSEAQVELWHGDQTAWLIRPPGGTLRGEPGEIASLIALGGDAVGVSSQDLEYVLEDETLKSGPARGISNVVAGPNPRVELQAGALLAVHVPGVA